MSSREITYVPYPTLMTFHMEHHYFLRGVCGPFGSGSSTACIQELMYIGMRQAPNKDKQRNVRMGVIRATYPNLKNSVRVDMLRWYPRECGGIKESVPMTGMYRIPLPDGTTLNMDLLLISADDQESVKKLRSLNLTAIWVNEATEVSPDVIDAAIERVGRYPTNEAGECSYGGVIMDYNKPPRGHWLHKMLHDGNLPSNYKLYMQPPAAYKNISEEGNITYTLNHNAENLRWLSDGYYQKIITSRMRKGDYDGIDQLLCLLDVDDKRGKPVWPMFSRTRHVAASPIQPISGQDLLISVDTSGIHPAALFWQFTGKQWAILDEVYGDGEGLEAFIFSGVVPLLRTKYSTVSSVFAVCDPANAKNSLTAVTPVGSLQEAGIPAKVASTNDPKARIETVARMLNLNTGGILISPTCELLIAACAGGYVYGKVAIRGTVDVAYSAKPRKDHHSHPADALQYGALHIMMEEDSVDSNHAVMQAMARKHKIRRRTM